MKVYLAGEQIELLSEKALYWPAARVLALSDVHLGKPESLQAQGIPIPSGAHREDLARMQKLIQQTGAKKVYILGDLIHHKNSWTAEIQRELADFFKNLSHVDWTLLLGNHERGSKPFLEKLPIHLVDGDLAEGPFLFSHGHDTGYHNESLFRIQGHIHPVIKLHQGAIRLRLPCFVLDAQGLTLPSFGVLTGGYEISRAKGRRIFAVTPETVFEVPGTSTRLKNTEI